LGENPHKKFIQTAVPRSGSYQLVIQLRQAERIAVGSLGEIGFERGYYVYTGRAKRTLRARLNRYVSRAGRAYWHVDHLLARARLRGVVVFPGLWRMECVLAGELSRHLARPPVARFGSSDCGCEGHLVLLGKARREALLNLRSFQSALGERMHLPRAPLEWWFRSSELGIKLSGQP